MSLLLKPSRLDFVKKEFGKADIKYLVGYFQVPLWASGFNLDLALDEWGKLKIYIKRNFRHLYSDSAASALTVWSRLIIQEETQPPGSRKPRYRNFLLLIKLLLSLPFSSATVERGFSLLGSRILTDKRRSLCKQRLNQLMFIRINVQILQELKPTFKEELLKIAAQIYMNRTDGNDPTIKKRKANHHRPNKNTRQSTSSLTRETGDLFFPSNHNKVLINFLWIEF